ncbi:hypothetical protein D0962_23155 [Leptolyngbyaceae cyanobacterium CCMR0082]|uniref:Uncharacterized protein n=1 Tax=Adonisia turfae CCMR0082 TaxID=2304604 RepID=A0A6M0SAT2_9CYAN|nr:hypothetical protein [Adonisia turfae]NEZ65619.1 hypothetical protein [Adonisia turfae CCMR0082]
MPTRVVLYQIEGRSAVHSINVDEELSPLGELVRLLGAHLDCPASLRADRILLPGEAAVVLDVVEPVSKDGDSSE